MSIIKKLQEESLNENYITSVLAKFLLAYEGDYEEIKIKQLCAKAHVSFAIPTRLAQKLGYNGFREFKYELVKYQQTKDKMVYNNDILDVSLYKQQLVDSIDHSFNTITMRDINTIANLIIKSERIKIYGVGQSYLIGLDLHSKLVRFNKISLCPSSESEIYTSSILSEPRDLVIAISYSGNTKQVMDALDRSFENGAKTILFTNNEQLSDNYDLVFQLHLIENQISNMSMISNSILLIIFDFIYLDILNKNSDYRAYLDKTSMKQ